MKGSARRVDCAQELFTHDFAIEVMLFHHYGVDSRSLFEGQEAKASRSSSLGVMHDGAVGDLTELFEIFAHFL